MAAGGKSTRGRLLRGCSQISQADKKPELRKVHTSHVHEGGELSEGGGGDSSREGCGRRSSFESGGNGSASQGVCSGSPKLSAEGNGSFAGASSSKSMASTLELPVAMRLGADPNLSAAAA